MDKDIVIVGYSGHSFVVIDALLRNGRTVQGYCDSEEKAWNPFGLKYIGSESSDAIIESLKGQDLFITIGSNRIRRKVFEHFTRNGVALRCNVVHPSAVIATKMTMGTGVFVSANACINPFSEIGDQVICNTGAIIEHECKISDFCHIAPGAVLAGNVYLGEESFVGANAVVKQGVRIGRRVTIGAGTVVIKDIPDDVTVAGNPARIIKSE